MAKLSTLLGAVSRFVSWHGISRATINAKPKPALAAAVAAAEAILQRGTFAARLKACPDTKRVFLRSCLVAITLESLIPFVTPFAFAQRIQFHDITSQAGIHFVHNNGAFGKKYLPETMGSGCAFIDYDNDGWPDILLVNGEDWPGHNKYRFHAEALSQQSRRHIYRRDSQSWSRNFNVRYGRRSRRLRQRRLRRSLH